MTKAISVYTRYARYFGRTCFMVMVYDLVVYTAHITKFHGGLQFFRLGEIGRQLLKAPLAAAISPYLISPTHLTHACV